ncbi:MAG: hypothetical protein ACK5QT_09295 [Oligoflexia bacterium]
MTEGEGGGDSLRRFLGGRLSCRLFKRSLGLCVLLSVKISSLQAQDLPHSRARSGYRPAVRGSVCMFESFARLGRQAPPFGLERSVELEIPADLVWPYLTTEDGTLAPLVKYYGWNRKDPSDLYPIWFQSRFGNRDPATIRWDQLHVSTQKSILNEATVAQNFLRDRVIHGLVIRSDRNHPLSRFQTQVEFGSSSDVGKIGGLELHLRLAAPASEVAQEARRAARQLGRDKQHLHVHLTLPFRADVLRANPLIESARIMEFFRRAELFAQMMTVMETQSNLRTILGQFSTLSPGVFKPLMSQLLSSGVSGRPLGKGFLAKSYVGIRGDRFYDVPGVWGLEVRAIHSSLSGADTTALLDGIESTGLKAGFGLEEGHIETWLNRSGIQVPTEGWPTVKSESSSSLPSEWSAESWNVPPEIERISRQITERLLPSEGDTLGQFDLLFTGPRRQAAREVLARWQTILRTRFESQVHESFRGLRRRGTHTGSDQPVGDALMEYPALMMVFHQWAQDPLFYSDPLALERIELARFAAIRKLGRDESPQQVIREFLQASGIYEAMGTSLGIRVTVFGP